MKELRPTTNEFIRELGGDEGHERKIESLRLARNNFCHGNLSKKTWKTSLDLFTNEVDSGLIIIMKSILKKK